MIDRIVKARSNLLISQPFFGTLALRLVLEKDTSIDTMSTDGTKILFNPDFVDQLDNDELMGVFAHEVLHCSNLHHLRMEGRDPIVWNEACDYAINRIILENGFKLPSGALVDAAFDGMSAEEIYAILPKDKPPGSDPNNGNSDPGRFGDIHEPKSEAGEKLSKSEKRRKEAEWKSATLQAHQTCKSAGKTPAGVERLIKSIKHPKIDWRRLLHKFISERDTSDYNWSRPNRRFIHQDIYLPSMESPALGEVVVICDTSGSIRQEQIDQVNAELNGILKTASPSLVTVLHCNVAITKVESFKPTDGTVTLMPVGSGGTDLKPPFEWMKTHGKKPAAIIYFTDLITSRGFPENTPAPLIWITPNKRKAPIGTTISLAYGE